MISRQIFLPFLCLALFFAAPAFAVDHAKEAFRLADRKEWSAAMNHAAKSRNATLQKIIAWQAYLDSGASFPFSDVASFVRNNPRWPDQRRLRVRAEQSLRGSLASADEVIAWFGNEPPITGAGKIALARAYIAQGNASEGAVAELVKTGWIQGDFDESQEQDILASFGDILTTQDHIERTSRLIWENRTSAAKRMLPMLPSDEEALMEVRIKLAEDKKVSSSALASVPESKRDDLGLVYNLARYYQRQGDDAKVRELLLTVPGNPPYPDKWWPLRERQARDAIESGDYTLAEKLLENHGPLSNYEMAEANWLSGWLHLEFLKRPRDAYTIFTRMYDSVGYPVSRARAAFWAGRAAAASGNNSDAATWYRTASLYPTTFYGQLAALNYGTTSLRLPPPPSIDSSTRANYESDELSGALKLALRYNARDIADKLSAHLIESTDDPGYMALVAETNLRAGHTYLGVRSAKRALQSNVVIAGSSYPRPDTPSGLAVERPLALAIARQESEFDSTAVSRAGARGLTQLLPSTAKETARKAGISYSKSKLFDPDYNFQVGSHYLSRMINNYDGSYIMAVAAYNAGPGNVRKWVDRFGTPGNNLTDSLNWIERIPFSETRNYVMRVMENLQVYRHLEAGHDDSELMLAQDLVR